MNVKSRMSNLKSETSKTSSSGSHKEGPNYSQKSTDIVGVAHDGNCIPYDPANSITWDIEKEGSAEKSEMNEHQGTIVVKLPRNLILSSKEKENDNALGGCVDMAMAWSDRASNSAARDTRLVEMSEVSLHPSQSASQIAEEQGKAPDAKCRPTSSKYFETRYSSPPDDGQILKDARAIRSTTPSLENRKPSTHQARLSPSSSPRIETDRRDPPTFTDPSLVVDSLPDVFDDISVADAQRISEHNTEEAVPYFSHDIAVPTYFDSDVQFRTNTENRVYNLGFDSVQYDYQDTYHDNSWDFAPSPDQLDNYAGFSDWAQVNGWCSNPCELDSNVETMLCAREVNEDVDTPIEECYDRFSDLGDNGRLELPDSFLATEFPDDTNSHSSLGSVGHVDNFSQGRFLLYCDNPAAQQVSSAEAEVARLLRQSHWVPHRF